MGTRSNIAIERENGTVEMVYCHWDGYPDHNGRLLLEHYSATPLVEELVGGGNVSSLEPTIQESKFYVRRSEWDSFGGQDEPWESNKPQVYPDRDGARCSMQEFLYIWVETEGRWVYSDHRGPFRPLTRAACGLDE